MDYYITMKRHPCKVSPPGSDAIVFAVSGDEAAWEAFSKARDLAGDVGCDAVLSDADGVLATA